MPSYEELINELSELCGIIPAYWDIFGKAHEAPLETKKSILIAMGIKTDTADNLSAEIEKRHQRPWNIFIDPVRIILHSEQPLTVTVHVPIRKNDEQSITFKCILADEYLRTDSFSFSREDIEIIESRVLEEILHLKIEIPLKLVKDIGYYTLDILYMSSGFGLSGSSRIIITPETCYLPDQMAPHAGQQMGLLSEHVSEKLKTWGLSINLYGIRSAKNWGIGDFSDLARIIEWIAELGGGFVGINPLHAIPNRKPHGISPYSPVSRLYKSFTYLDVETVPDVLESDRVQELFDTEDFQEELEMLRDSEYVDYEKVAAVKKIVLELAFDSFYENHLLKDSPRAALFRKYLLSEGELLELFATFMALQEKLDTEFNAYSWLAWPEQYRDPHAEAVRNFQTENQKEILYYQYLQWLINEQQSKLSESTGQFSMPVGIYQDLAVGSSGDSFDAWVAGNIIAPGMDVGAPPDAFSPAGQNWGFPPFCPDKMRESGYDFFIQTLRKNMQYAGALRIDHALGMFRLFWIPSGSGPAEGAYVKYPSEEILRIIALESVLNKTILIAEDLGTVGENVRETLFRFRMLSYKILYFERNYPDPSFTIPERYTDLALCAVTTHDLPTLYGYWSGRDIEEKTRLGLYPNDESRTAQLLERERDKGLLLNALKGKDLLPEDFSTDPKALCIMISSLCLTIYEYLSMTPCKLLGVSLDDVIGVMDQQNMPGTTDSYPNWLRKTPVSFEKIMANRSFVTLSKIFKRNHR